MSEPAACLRCGAILSAYRLQNEPEGLCAPCAAVEAPTVGWRVLEPERLVLAVAGVLASEAADQPCERVHVQAALEARGILADHIDVHMAVDKLRRRYAWRIGAIEGRAGYRLEEWPFSFTRRRQGCR